MSRIRKTLIVGAIAIASQQPVVKTIANSVQPVKTTKPLQAMSLSDELITRGVGHAEGTRTADGLKTRAYYGHSDPGNAVWNLGSFSFQHCREAKYNCSTPEEADKWQLDRLKRQSAVLLEKAKRLKLKLSLEEMLNAIDLANQAPLAALDDGGFIERLAQAKALKKKGADAILWARAESYRNPRTQQLEAPGLGNTIANVRHDQNRRMAAIQRAMELYRQQKGVKPVSAGQYELNRLVIQDLIEQGVKVK